MHQSGDFIPVADIEDFGALAIRKKGLVKVAKFTEHTEYTKNRAPTGNLTKELALQGADVYTFL